MTRVGDRVAGREWAEGRLGSQKDRLVRNPRPRAFDIGQEGISDLLGKRQGDLAPRLAADSNERVAPIDVPQSQLNDVPARNASRARSKRIARSRKPTGLAASQQAITRSIASAGGTGAIGPTARRGRWERRRQAEADRRRRRPGIEGTCASLSPAIGHVSRMPSQSG